MKKKIGLTAVILLIVVIILGYKIINKENKIPKMFIEYNTINGYTEKVSLNNSTASWKFNFLNVVMDGNHPLDSIGHIAEIKKEDILDEISISFSSTPISYTVRYWPDSYIGNQDAYENYYNIAEILDGKIHLPNDGQGYIYEIHGIWSRGDAYFAFYITNDK